MPGTMAEHAQAFAQLGWPVLPLYTPDAEGRCSCGSPDCRSVGKHPQTKHGVHDATKDPAEVAALCRKFPEANIGVPTGLVSGIIVLDVDPRNGGDASLTELEALHGPLPDTVEARTGGGGRHFYFKAPEHPVAKRRVAPGLDLQAEGAYVVAPPSRHASGESYRWVLGRSPFDIPLADAPSWLLDAHEIQRREDQPPSIEQLLDAVGQLDAESSTDEVGEWLHNAADIASRDELAGRGALFRAAAISRLKLVKWVKAPAQVVDEALGASRRKTVESAQDEPEELSEEVRAMALKLLKRSGLLGWADFIMSDLGLSGEDLNKRIVFLSAVAGHLGDPIHLVIHGSSAGGKNNLVRAATALLPPARVLWVSGLSEHALEYLGGRIEGVLVIDEAEGQEDAVYTLRVAMSEGVVSRITVNRSDSGRNEAQHLQVEVVASVITTTTEPALHDETQTRVFDLWIDESEGLTAKILVAQAAAAAGGSSSPPEMVLEVFRAAMQLLEPLTVVIPYAPILAERFPKDLLRARRDFLRVLALIRASTLLHQFQRARDQEGGVVAEVADYGIVLPLIQATLGQSRSGVSEKAHQLHRLQKELEQPMAEGWLRRVDLEREAGKRGIAASATVHTWAARFRDLGIWEGRMEKRAWEHRIIKDPEDSSIPLPTAAELAELIAMPG